MLGRKKAHGPNLSLAEGKKEKRGKGTRRRFGKEMVREEGRNLQKRVLTAGGKEEMDGDPLKRLLEAEKAVKSD